MTKKHDHESIEKQKSGMSSFKRTNTQLIFDDINLKVGDVFLDIGCGAGDYSFKAAEMVGESGFVYALDQWKEIEENLIKKASSLGIKNIKALTADITSFLPIKNISCDVCFISMVIHGVDLSKYGKELFEEIKRGLKPNGKLVIVEFKKEETQFGPPVEIRLSSEELENIVTDFGFRKLAYTDLDYSYMLQFGVIKG